MYIHSWGKETLFDNVCEYIFVWGKQCYIREDEACSNETVVENIS